MDDNVVAPPPRRIGLKVALVCAGIAAGAIGATAIGAGAATTSGSGSATAAYGASNGSAPNGSAPSGSAPSGSGRAFDHGGSTPVRRDEKSVSTSVASTLKAAALKAVPGGTVYRVETDAGDGAYEVHMTKSDGRPVTVKFDKNLKVTKVESGMGTGDPAPHR